MAAKKSRAQVLQKRSGLLTDEEPSRKQQRRVGPLLFSAAHGMQMFLKALEYAKTYILPLILAQEKEAWEQSCVELLAAEREAHRRELDRMREQTQKALRIQRQHLLQEKEHALAEQRRCLLRAHLHDCAVQQQELLRCCDREIRALRHLSCFASGPAWGI